MWTRRAVLLSMPHAALCVSGLRSVAFLRCHEAGFNAARSIVCVGTHFKILLELSQLCFNAARSIVCVGTVFSTRRLSLPLGFNAARSIVCVGTRNPGCTQGVLPCFNAARSIVCVGTLCPAALVPRGLRRLFGKTRFFAPFLASADEICPKKRGIHRRCPLCGAGCTVLERRNGRMRLCARAGALPISFSSIIAHASFFFNDVFARVGGQMFSKKSMASVMLYMSLMDVCPLILSSLSRLHCA